MYSNQLTIEEAQENVINNNRVIGADDCLLMQGYNWGSETAIGTIEDWENEIPESETKAKSTGWYDWFVNDEHYEHLSWLEYREYLLSQLIDVEIV